MTLFGLVILLIIAAICGSIGQAIAGYSVGGCLVSIVVGLVGAFLGLWLAHLLGLPELLTLTIEGETFPIVWSIIGSTLLAVILGLFTRNRRRLV
jgi:uncharacterized membrane protein YeaQ/YmgE (transglycosylase-associated protein family)